MSQLSMNGLELIKHFEGKRLEPYTCPAGYPTIGYGHRLTAPSGPITEARANSYLAQDVLFAERCVAKLVDEDVTLTQGQFDALVDFVFNMGVHRLAESTLLRLVNASAFENAGLELLKWDHSKGVKLPGLTKRRAAEFALWTGQDWRTA